MGADASRSEGSTVDEVTEGYTVAVRSMCEFTARRGDLCVRFTPSPTAEEGIAGHGTVAGRRGPNYQREIRLHGRYRALTVRGRADGYDPDCNRLEEFKTHRGDVGLIPPNQRALHWAQLRIYGALLCAHRGLDAVELAVVYFDVRTGEETAVRERCTAADLDAHFEDHCGRFLAWAMRELRHRAGRDRCLAALAFPHHELRAGQRRMAEAVYTAARRGRPLMVQAPTGIGKTLGSLFPLLKAAPNAPLDKIFFLVAKTSGRAQGLAALARLVNSAAGANAAATAPLRVLEMVAKDSACVYPGRACDGSSCPLAAGFFDRLPGARQAALERSWLDREAVRELAATATVCPYFLAQELTRWCDVVVGDYNYFFDTRALLHALTAQNQWRVAVLVDEAHNLLPRARSMYSAALEPDALRAALDCSAGRVQRALAAARRAWDALYENRSEDYFVESAIAAPLLGALQRAAAAIADGLAEAAPAGEPVLRFYFDVLHFIRMADCFGAHSLFDVTRTQSGAALTIRNVNPSLFLESRFKACRTAVLFSATLSPADYYRRLLGVGTAAWIEVESPFDARQLDVHVARGISTRYRDRQRSLAPIAEVMARQYRERPGNYLAFFGSFAYLQAAFGTFRRRFPEIAAREQSRAMSPAEREAFLAGFTPTSRGIGFAVLGGVFAEGVDLPGARLIGAFIATLGMPGVSVVNAEIERRMQQLFQAGYEYTYLYPGLEKVVQAAGRVIRTEADRGTLHLLDDRYSVPEVRALLPRWWRLTGDALGP